VQLIKLNQSNTSQEVIIESNQIKSNQIEADLKFGRIGTKLALGRNQVESKSNRIKLHLFAIIIPSGPIIIITIIITGEVSLIATFFERVAEVRESPKFF
jgi:hypothetical protein